MLCWRTTGTASCPSSRRRATGAAGPRHQSSITATSISASLRTQNPAFQLSEAREERRLRGASCSTVLTHARVDRQYQRLHYRKRRHGLSGQAAAAATFYKRRILPISYTASNSSSLPARTTAWASAPRLAATRLTRAWNYRCWTTMRISTRTCRYTSTTVQCTA